MITIAAATCLALNVYFEARNQEPDGQRMVAEVTMQRVSDPNFPDDVCDVVWQPGAFSWTSDGLSDTPLDAEAWLRAQMVAYDVMLNGCQLCTGATYYHEVSVHPYWAKIYSIVGQYGDHIFYVNSGEKNE